MAGGGMVDLGIDGLSEYREIGSGGFATVYSAVEAAYGRPVAVKVFAAVDEAGRRRFDRERLAMGQASSHPNIVLPLRGGYTPNGDQPYLVMEHLGGGSLQDRLEQGPMHWDEAIAAVIAVAGALGHSHRAGIVHKDIKPANILLTDSGVPKLSDFGVAALQEGTATAQMAFSLLYTAPETFTGDAVDMRDERSDLWSLAATLYALGTGAPPYTGASTAALISQILSAPPPPTGRDDLDRFFATALAKDPDHRFRTTDDFVAALRGQSVPIRPQGPDSQATTRPDPARTGNHGAPGANPVPSPQPRPRRGLVAAAVVAIAALVVGGVAVALSRGGDDSTAETATAGAPDDSTVTTTAVEQPDPESGEPEATEPAVELIPTITDATVVTNHRPGPVSALVQLADGRVASGGWDGVIHLWDPADPQASDTMFLGHTGAISAIVQLPDGRIVSANRAGAFVTSATPALQIWDPADPAAAPVSADGHGSTVGGLVAFENGLFVSVASSDRVRISTVSDPLVIDGDYKLADITTGGGFLQTMIGLSDQRVAIASSNVVDVWDPREPVASPSSYTGHADSVRAVVELANGQLASAAGVEVHAWSPLDPAAPRATWTSPGAEPRAIAELQDRRVVIGDAEGRFHWWDPASGESGQLAVEQPGPILAIEPLADGRVASAGNDGVIQLWAIDDDTSSAQTVDLHAGPVDAVTQLADGRIASAGTRDGVQVWDLADAANPRVYENEALVFPGVYSVDQLGDGRVAFASTSDGALHLWAPEDGGSESVIPTDDEAGLSYDPLIQLDDGRLVGDGPDDGLRVWSLDDPAATQSLYGGHTFSPVVLASLADGRVASGDGLGEIHVWDPADPDIEAVIYTQMADADDSPEVMIALSDGRLAVGGNAGDIHLWNPDEPGSMTLVEHHIGTVMALVELPDGRIASGGIDGTVQVWGLDEPETVLATYDRATWVTDLTLLDDGRLAASGGNGVHIFAPTPP